MSKLGGYLDDFEKATTEANSKRQVVEDLSSELKTAKDQLDVAENKVREANANLQAELAVGMKELENKGLEVTSKG